MKFILKDNFDKIHNFIIILDDIEMLDYDAQRKLIESVLKFKEEMCFNELDDRINNKDHFTKLLISLRPDSYYRILRDERIESFALKSFAFLNIDELNLSKLFEKRFKYYTQIYVGQYENSPKWSEAYRVLMKLSKKLNDRYGALIKKICCYNIQKSLVVFADILSNRYYVQPNNSSGEAFSVLSPKHFTLSNHSVIRAISCRENRVFFGDGSDSVLPNIFLTSLNDDHSVECLLIIHYYRNRQYYQPILDSFYLGAESLKKTRLNWQHVFGESITNRLCIALKYLLEKTVIRRFITESTSNSFQDKVKSDDAILLCLSPMGELIYELLCWNSEALELFREAAWREYNYKKYSVLPSSELWPNTLRKQSRQDALFIDLLEYISYLSENEFAIIKDVKKNNTLDKYCSFFGLETVSSRLLFGVKSTILRFGINQKYPEVINTFNQTENKVFALQEFIEKNTTL